MGALNTDIENQIERAIEEKTWEDVIERSTKALLQELDLLQEVTA